MFILNTQIPGKIILVNSKEKPTYLFSKNLQIRHWHRNLEYALNTKIIAACRLIDKIDIINNHQLAEQQLFSYSKEKEKDKNSEFFSITMLLKITNMTNDNLNNFEEINFKNLCNPCIENKYIKIPKYKKMILIICKL